MTLPSSFPARSDGRNDALFLGMASDGRPIMQFSGHRSTDGTIVTEVGADIHWADGSIYVSDTGAIFQKQSDVWTQVLDALADASVDENKLADTVAGDGLAGGAGDPLSVNVDGSTIVITTDTLGVKAGGIGATQLGAGAVTKTKLGTGFAKISVVAGEDETSTHQITVTGMAVGDEVIAVLVLTTAASIATMAAHAGTLTAASGKITPGTEVNNTNNQYIVFWHDLT